MIMSLFGIESNSLAIPIWFIFSLQHYYDYSVEHIQKTHDPRILKTWTATEEFLFLFWSKEVIKWRQIFWLPDFFGDVALVISLGA